VRVASYSAVLTRVARHRDAALAVGLCAAGQYELFAHVTYDGAAVWPGPRWVNAVLIPLLTLPLAARRRWPTAVCLSLFAGLAVTSAALGGGEAATTFVLFIATTFTAAAHARWPVLTGGAAITAGAVHVLRDPHVHGIGDVVWVLGILAIAWFIGWAVRTRVRRIGTLESQAAEAEMRHAEQVAAATAAERAAIARELHDIVAHAVSVIVIQAQAGVRALPHDVDLATRVFEQIETSGRSALGELRGLLTLLAERPGPADVRPVASLAQLDELLDRCRASGLRVELDVEEPLPTLSAVADLAAYRVIQEALTNTLRHAPGATAHVRVRQNAGFLEIRADDDGASACPVRPRPTEGSGRGLIGMRERLGLAGGRLVHAAPGATGFEVHAVVPVERSGSPRAREPIP
jgi:signal transduction histidine kinase